MTKYLTISIANNSQLYSTKTGLADDEIYLFFTQQTKNIAWSIDATTGIATPLSSVGTLPANSFTLADLKAAGGEIKIDSNTLIDSARIYLTNSKTALTTTNGVIGGPTAGTAEFYYDFFEFAITGTSSTSPPNNLNIDTTQVDQLGIPMTLQVTPNDPNFPQGSGIESSMDRQSLFVAFVKMATGSLSPFTDCVYPTGSIKAAPYRLTNPSDVISSQLSAINLEGTIATSGTAGAWKATFTITGPGNPIPTNGAISVGMNISGPLIPAGTSVSALSGSYAIEMVSKATVNPFLATTTAVGLCFFNPVKTALGTYFDKAVDDFFDYYLANPNVLQVEQNNGGDKIYLGNVTEVQNIPDINGTTSTYTVLQFTNGNETYNIYYPFFTTNSPAGKQTPYAVEVPPPPIWWAWGKGLNYLSPPSLMVFGANGVFADNTLQPLGANASSAVQGALENVVVTALVRGHATSWQFLNGTITTSTTNDKSASVTLGGGANSQGLVDKSYLSSFQIANVPMTVDLPSTGPVTTFEVTSPLKIPSTIADLLTFAVFYPSGGIWSAFAYFLHNGTDEITIDGRAYALPFDDQGGFSSDLNAATSKANPAKVAITLGPWSPQKS